MVYLNGDLDLQIILSRVEYAGGKIHQQKKRITAEVGCVAIFAVTEGNRVALHSRQ